MAYTQPNSTTERIPNETKTLTGSYVNPIKNQVRNDVLSRSVLALTTDRKSSRIVRPSEVCSLVEYFLKVMNQSNSSVIAKSTWMEFERWENFHESRCTIKARSDLKVIYLCGPEPLNDLKVLVELGLNPLNIWAVESDAQQYNISSKIIECSGVPVKLHFGSIEDFFENVKEVFDIAYIDGTRPFLSRKPRSLSPIFNVLNQGRLEPLSALVTNFCEPPVDEHARYSQVITDFFRYRHNDVPDVFNDSGLDPAIGEHDPTGYDEAILRAMPEYYSELITRFTIDIARFWIPTVTALASGHVLNHYTTKQARQAAIQRALGPDKVSGGEISDIFNQLGDTQRSPSSYPLLSFLRSLASRRPVDPLVAQLKDWKPGTNNVEHLIHIGQCLDRIVENHWDVASPELKQAIGSSWFDISAPYTCDVPLANLVVNTLIGIYGYPHYRSATASKRWMYTAQTNTMFADLHILDRCRSYFDWFPTISLVPSRFNSVAFQIVTRCILDRINACDTNSDTHPFRGASVAGFYGLAGAPFHHVGVREVVK